MLKENKNPKLLFRTVKVSFKHENKIKMFSTNINENTCYQRTHLKSSRGRFIDRKNMCLDESKVMHQSPKNP